MSLAFREELISQIFVLRLLMALGYRYLPPEEALALRVCAGLMTSAYYKNGGSFCN